MPDSLYGLLFLILTGLGGYIVKGIRSDALSDEMIKLNADTRARIASLETKSAEDIEEVRRTSTSEIEDLRAVVKHLDQNLHSALNEKAELWKQIASLQERDAVREQQKSALAIQHLDEKRMREDLEAQLAKARAELERAGQTITEQAQIITSAQTANNDLQKQLAQSEKANAYLSGKNDGMSDYIHSFQITAVTNLANPVPEEEKKPDAL